jgi:hypothetical protein
MIASYQRVMQEWRKQHMVCDRCREDRYTLYNLHMLGTEERACVNCLTNDEYDFVTSDRWPQEREEYEL